MIGAIRYEVWEEGKYQQGEGNPKGGNWIGHAVAPPIREYFGDATRVFGQFVECLGPKDRLGVCRSGVRGETGPVTCVLMYVIVNEPMQSEHFSQSQ